MFELTVDIQTSAQVLGLTSQTLRDFLEREQPGGVLKVQGNWRVSIFTLARLLATNPENLLDFLEDYNLGQRIAEVADDEILRAAEARQTYQACLTEEGQ